MLTDSVNTMSSVTMHTKIRQRLYIITFQAVSILVIDKVAVLAILLYAQLQYIRSVRWFIYIMSITNKNTHSNSSYSIYITTETVVTCIVYISMEWGVAGVCIVHDQRMNQRHSKQITVHVWSVLNLIATNDCSIHSYGILEAVVDGP